GRAFERLPMTLGHWFGGIFLAAGIIALVGAYLLSGSISHPLIEISQMAQQVEEGDLTARVEVRSQDEVGVLAHAFNTMTAGQQFLAHFGGDHPAKDVPFPFALAQPGR
ncbi:hypothetical protein DC030_15180, partial [Enterococcus faecalis]